MQVKNIKIIEDKILYKNTIFNDIINNNLHLLPQFLHKQFKFEIINTNNDFANAIRRCLINELDIKILTVHMSDIFVDDKYLLTDLIKDRIELLSINQNIPDNLKFQLNVTNDTLNIMNIMSSDLIPNDGSSNNNYFNTNIKICELNSNKTIVINNIKVNTNNGIFNSKYELACIEYEVINTDFTINSLNNNVTDFRFNIRTNGNIELYNIITMVVNNLETRLKLIESNIINTDLQFQDFYITKTLDITEYHINNEKWTIGNLLCWYVYIIDNTIVVFPYEEHELKNKIIIKIIHNDPNKILLKAIKLIINDLHLFKRSFIKN